MSTDSKLHSILIALFCTISLISSHQYKTCTSYKKSRSHVISETQNYSSLLQPTVTTRTNQRNTPFFFRPLSTLIIIVTSRRTFHRTVIGKISKAYHIAGNRKSKNNSTTSDTFQNYQQQRNVSGSVRTALISLIEEPTTTREIVQFSRYRISEEYSAAIFRAL